MKNIILYKEHKKFFLLQRNNYLTNTQKKIRKIFGRYLFTNYFVNYFNSLSKINRKLNKEFSKEFNELIEFLPIKVNHILDIGSGLGVMDVYLNNFYKNKPNFVLIDKDRIEKKVKYGFEEKGQAYNKIEISQNFLIKNGIEKKKLFFVDADKKYELKQNFDLVISLLSMGYHYPINQYFNVFNISKNIFN